MRSVEYKVTRVYPTSRVGDNGAEPAYVTADLEAADEHLDGDFTLDAGQPGEVLIFRTSDLELGRNLTVGLKLRFSVELA